VIRFSLLRRVGVQPGTREPGAPVLPPGGVMPAGAGEVGNVGGKVVVLEAIGQVLGGHIVDGDGGIPGFEGVAGVLGEVGRAGGGGGVFDGRQEDEVATGIVDAAAAEGEGVASRSNRRQLQTMKPRKLCLGPVLPLPKQLTPPPDSQPASMVRVAAPLLMGCIFMRAPPSAPARLQTKGCGGKRTHRRGIRARN